MRYTDEFFAKTIIKLQERLERGIISPGEFESGIAGMRGEIPDLTPLLRRQITLDQFLKDYPSLASKPPISPDELRLALSQGVDQHGDRLRYFVAQFQPGDELWEWVVGESLASKFGCAIIRNGQTVDYIMTGWS